jgi:hypothetical protein
MSPVSSTVPLTIEPGSGELGIKNKNRELRPNIIAQRLGECLVTGTLKGVYDGTYNGSSAALLLFHFNFHSPLSQKMWRYTDAKIEITFSRDLKPHEVDVDDGKAPRIVSIFPYAVNGNVSEEHRRWAYELSVPVGLNTLSPVDIKVEPKISKESSFIVGHRMQIQGLVYSSNRKLDLSNVATWDMSENDIQETGIPHDFRCGLVVLHGGVDFQANIQVKFSIPLGGGLRLTGWPWTKDDPLLFDRGTRLSRLDQNYLQQLETRLRGKDLAMLTEEDVHQLAPFSIEYQVFHKYWFYN